MRTEEDLIQLMKLNRKEIEHLLNLGILKTTAENCQSYHIGKSDYSRRVIQPWNIWKEYNLNPWDADIVKRVLRTKEGESRRLDYEKIIHICKERIRQIDASEEAKSEEAKSDDVDGTTVFCVSEEYKPTYASDGHYFRVHSVFKQGNHWYAYVGYSAQNSAHMYISLTDGGYTLTTISAFPLPVVLVSNSLGLVEHTASVKIGVLGTEYKQYDYLINDGKLYRFMGLADDGKLFKYARFMGGNDIGLIEIPYKLRNYAKQAACEK